MSGLDIVFIVAGLFGLAAAGGGYVFAASIHRQYNAAEEEEAPRPFLKKGSAPVTRTPHEFRAVVRAADDEHEAEDIHLPTNISLAPQEVGA